MLGHAFSITVSLGILTSSLWLYLFI